MGSLRKKINILAAYRVGNLSVIPGRVRLTRRESAAIRKAGDANGINRSTISSRIARGWSPERASTTPALSLVAAARRGRKATSWGTERDLQGIPSKKGAA